MSTFSRNIVLHSNSILQMDKSANAPINKNPSFLSPLHCRLYTAAIMESERIKNTAEIAITAAIYPR